ncbi:MAG: hypothetical protein R6V83_13775 [Candidatus Thorarchaeota archaeon]
MMAVKALAWPGVAPRYGGDAGQGKGGTQEFHTVGKTVRNGLSGDVNSINPAWSSEQCGP